MKMVAVMAVMFVSVVMANQRFIISYHLDCVVETRRYYKGNLGEKRINETLVRNYDSYSLWY